MKQTTYFCDKCGKKITESPFVWEASDGFRVEVNEPTFGVSIRIKERAPTMPCIEWIIPDLCQSCFRVLVVGALKERLNARGD